MGDIPTQECPLVTLQHYSDIFLKAVDTSSLERKQEPLRSTLNSQIEKDTSERQQLRERLQKIEERLTQSQSTIHDLDVELEDSKKAAASETLQQYLRPELLESCVC